MKRAATQAVGRPGRQWSAWARSIAGVTTVVAVLGLAPKGMAAPPSADLAISMSDAPDPAQVGSDVTYSISVTNETSTKALRATVTDELPQSVTLRSANASQGSCRSDGTVICDLGTLEASATASVTIIVRTEAEGQIDNTSRVAHQHSDSDPSDNSATTSTTVAGSPGDDLAQCAGTLKNEYRYDSWGRESITAAGSCMFVASGNTAQGFIEAATFPLKWTSCVPPICYDPRFLEPKYPNVHVTVSSPDGAIASCSLVYSCVAIASHQVPAGTPLTCSAYASTTWQDMPVMGTFACSSK